MDDASATKGFTILREVEDQRDCMRKLSGSGSSSTHNSQVAINQLGAHNTQPAKQDHQQLYRHGIHRDCQFPRKSTNKKYFMNSIPSVCQRVRSPSYSGVKKWTDFLSKSLRVFYTGTDSVFLSLGIVTQTADKGVPRWKRRRTGWSNAGLLAKNALAIKSGTRTSFRNFVSSSCNIPLWVNQSWRKREAEQSEFTSGKLIKDEPVTVKEVDKRISSKFSELTWILRRHLGKLVFSSFFGANGSLARCHSENFLAKKENMKILSEQVVGKYVFGISDFWFSIDQLKYFRAPQRSHKLQACQCTICWEVQS